MAGDRSLKQTLPTAEVTNSKVGKVAKEGVQRFKERGIVRSCEKRRRVIRRRRGEGVPRTGGIAPHDLRRRGHPGVEAALSHRKRKISHRKEGGKTGGKSPKGEKETEMEQRQIFKRRLSPYSEVNLTRGNLSARKKSGFEKGEGT